ncbi:hypothetical protein MVEN_02117800 [Mycena venus]|uniref:Uncharacterized protein n=1 Tax=Mycena venus TaxID=2733690 RepID=A0A8H7CGH8_9AGAR|nr:hypothetical protein MVEN_02117800 [Mycena venus]
MPELPPELEREIFELAFKPNNRNVALKLTLCLVARRVQFWIDRLFYEMVTIAHQRNADKFLSIVHSNSKPAGYFTVVKRLCIIYGISGATARDILSACPSVEALGCWVDKNDSSWRDPDSGLFLLISRLPLRRLSIEASLFSSIPATLSSTWPSTLTHLDLFPLGKFPTSELSRLAHLPRLTHVCLHTNRNVGVGHVAMVCSNSPQLQVLILLGGSIYPPDSSDPHQHDSRIVVQDNWMKSFGPVEDWEASYLGLSDMWTRAEATVAQRVSPSTE